MRRLRAWITRCSTSRSLLAFSMKVTSANAAKSSVIITITSTEARGARWEVETDAHIRTAGAPPWDRGA